LKYEKEILKVRNSANSLKTVAVMLIMISLSTTTAAQKTGSVEDIEKKEAEVAHLSSAELGREYKKIIDVQRERMKNSGKMSDASLDDDFWRSFAIQNQIEKRKKNGDKEATYQYARIKANLCATLVSEKKEYGEKTCAELETDLRSIADQDDRAMSILAIMYEEGIWFEKSKFAASDWYLKIAEFYENIKRREEMLTNLEKALTLNPNSRRAKDFANRVM
jgi:tetratricopeptide (TPR) repeat protein